eukprot:1589186-Heterocapsa_arctica.AAC.1
MVVLADTQAQGLAQRLKRGVNPPRLAQGLTNVGGLRQHPFGRMPMPQECSVHLVAVAPGAQGLLKDVDEDAQHGAALIMSSSVVLRGRRSTRVLPRRPRRAWQRNPDEDVVVSSEVPDLVEQDR